MHGDGEDYRLLLERLRSLPPVAETKVSGCQLFRSMVFSTSLRQAEENALLAKLTLDDAYIRFRADMFLSSLTESSQFLWPSCVQPDSC